MKKKILLGLLLILAIAQFVRPDISIPEFDEGKDFFTEVDAPEDIKKLIHAACYDCHSYKTHYPWYNTISPISWWLQDHVEEGREHLNFSLWADLSHKKADHKLEEGMEMLEENEMPLDSYTWIHSEADLSDEQRSALIQFFKNLRSNYQ